MPKLIVMHIVVEVADEVAAREDAQFHYSQMGRGILEENAYMPENQPLDVGHALLEATLAWVAETDLKLVSAEVEQEELE